MTLHPWVCCVRLNDNDKAYFLRQVEGFRATDPLMVTWQDHRDEKDPNLAVYVPNHPFEAPLPSIPGANRLRQITRHIRGAIKGQVFEAGAAEIAEFKSLKRPDVIYAHTGFVAVRMRSVAKALGVPLVAHFHGLDVTREDPIYQREVARVLPECAAVIVVGEWMRDWMLARGVTPERLHVVPMGTDMARCESYFDPNPAQNARFRFITVGRLVGVKGIDRVIEAIGLLRDQGIEAELQVVGDGPLRGPLTALSQKLGLTDRILFEGQKSSDAALALIAKADAMAHHALDKPGGPEAFGVVITEAMALGKPVVGTWCGGLPDQIIDGETGLLSAQNDVAAMAAHMAQMVQNPDQTRAMGQASRDRARSCFDSRVLGARVEAILADSIDT